MKKIISIISFLLFTCSLNAQWTVDNSNVIGGSGDEDFNDIIEVENGYLAVGFTTSSNNGDISAVNNGFSDYWIVRFDLDGNIIWEKTYGGLGNDIANAIEVTESGNFWVFGTIDSSGTQINNYFGEKDAWGIEIDLDGELLNQATFGGSEDDIIKDIAYNDNNILYLVGETTSTDGNIISNYEQKNAWLATINESGELLNSTTFGGNNKDGFNAIEFDSANNLFYIGGYTNSDDGDIATPSNLTDTWLVALNNETKQIIWEKTWGGTSAEIIIDIELLENGDIAFCGETSSPDIENFQGTFDILAGVYNSNSDLLWAKAIGGSAADSPLKIVENQQNDLAILAYSNSLGGNIGFGYQAFNIWLGEINAANGEIRRSQIFGGNRWDFGSALVPLTDNGYFLLGNTDSFDGDVIDGSGKNSGGKKANSKDGNHDIWVAKLSDIPTSNNAVLNNNLSPFSIYPNPCDSFFHIQKNSKNIQEITIFNPFGQTVFQTKHTQALFDVSSLSSGNYFVKITDNDQKIWFQQLNIVR